jgi:hypothetical protein
VFGCVSRLASQRASDLAAAIVRVEIHPTTVQIVLRRLAFFSRAGDPDVELKRLSDRLSAGERIARERASEELVRVTLPCRLKFHSGRIWISGDGVRAPLRTERDPVLIRALQAGHDVIATMSGAPLGRPECATLNQAPARAYDRLIARLAFLAPDVQAMILEGRHPVSLNLQSLMFKTMPAAWEDQRRLFGLAEIPA